MARSKCVYVVFGTEREVLAAFTVKHELVSYLSRNAWIAGRWRVVRAPDGDRDELPTGLDIAELIGASA